jgi:succinoglycan biosynthesis protein ExoA
MLTVSVIVPCYNEEKTIFQLLLAIYQQTWPKSDMEVIIADGISKDRTREKIAEFQAGHPDLAVQIVDNDRRNIPAALNSALAAARGEFIVRLDGHSEPAQDYIERCLSDLKAGCGEMVGGIWLIRPGGPDWMAKSIAAASSHPFGVGDALYRYATQPVWVDTVPFGAFRRQLIERIGPYDETLLTNEDYEFNTRIRQSGGKIWLDPAIQSAYYARSTLQALSRQYWRYGFWKYKMLQRYPKTLRWRQALPPVFTFSLILLVLLALFWQLARFLLLFEIVLYLAVLVGGAIPNARQQREPRLLFGIPAAIAVMHLSWGSGFIGSVIKSTFGRKSARV